MKEDINQILQLYLGTDDTGGYQPIGCNARIKEAYPKTYQEQLQKITKHLAEEHAPDWTKNDLIEEVAFFQRDLLKNILSLKGILPRH